MIGRLRLIVPSWGVLTFALFFLFFEAPVLYFEWRLGRRMLDLRIRPGTTLVYVAAAFYGMYRAVVFHPFCREDYRKWLEQTPWTVHRPLPMGPIPLIWEDGIILGLLILITLTQPIHSSVRILS